MMTLEDIAMWLQLPKVVPIPITGVSIDTRTLQPGHLFVALVGAKFDGHDFIETAYQKGAVAVLCHHTVPNCPIPQLVMPCTLDALAVIATQHRKRLHCPTIAVTGSNGKTTVKEMIAMMLPQPSFATYGNLNNHIGVPLSLLALNPAHRYAVFELGANHVGEIAHTVSMVQPDVTLINNVAPAHLEGFGSFEGVVRAKGEIHAGLSRDGIAVINADDPSAHAWDELLVGKKITRFSIEREESIYATRIRTSGLSGSLFDLVTPEGVFEVTLQVPGLHNVSNAVAAMTCVRALGVTLPTAIPRLAHFSGVPGRLMMFVGPAQSKIIDDTYNANLKSVLAGLDVLVSHPGQHILVLGDLGELGEHTLAHHERIGLAAKALKIDAVLTCGQHSRATTEAFGDGAVHYETQDALCTDLLGRLDSQTTVLVKGSRSSTMETIVQKLTQKKDEKTSCFIG